MLISLFTRRCIPKFIGLLGIALVASCSEAPKGSKNSKSSDTVPFFSYTVVNTYPHDRRAYTQGLVFENGFLYEGTGIRGGSALRKVELKTGNILQIRKLPAQFFGEGLTIYENKIIQLTWVSKVGFVYDKESFELLREFNYPMEGWGITHDGRRLIMSDGTSTLHFLDPENFEETERIEVCDNDRPVTGLNELEYVRDEIYANILGRDSIARIAPQTGRVIAWIELKGILGKDKRSNSVGALNGIAYDAKNDRLFVTGKFWPSIFVIELIPRD